MKACTGLAALLLLAWAAPAAAQEPTPRGGGVAEDVERIIEESGIATAIDSVATESAPELDRALGELALALSGIFDRVANDPELRRSALAAAQGMVGVAEVVVAANAEIIQDVLRTAAEELERLPDAEPGSDGDR